MCDQLPNVNLGGRFFSSGRRLVLWLLGGPELLNGGRGSEELTKRNLLETMELTKRNILETIELTLGGRWRSK